MLLPQAVTPFPVSASQSWSPGEQERELSRLREHLICMRSGSLPPNPSTTRSGFIIPLISFYGKEGRDAERLFQGLDSLLYVLGVGMTIFAKRD